MARDEEEQEFEEEEDSDFEGGSGGDDDEEELEEEEEEDAGKGRSSKASKAKASSSRGAKGKAASGSKRKKSQFIEADEAEEDDDEEEEGDGGGGRKRPKASRFIDDIAAVDSDEEEEEADEEMDDMLAHEEDLGGEELGGANAAAHYRDLELRRGDKREQTEEEMAKYIEEKYKEADYDDEEDDYGHYGEEEDVGQQGLQPTKEDPGLFIVTCRLGSEREACMQLLQKCYNMAERGTPLAIKSAVCLDHLKGFFYVEAFRDSHVMEAVRGLRTIFPSKGARLVPLKERPAAITVNRAAKAAIERDSWVRVRGGLYKDDLAKVVDVDFAGGRATIKLVPRLDLAAMAKDHMGGGGRRNPFGRQAVRPPPKPWRSREAGDLGLPVGKDRNDPNVFTLNTHRFIEGYTLRSYTLKGLILQDVAPPLDEISRFNQAGQSGEVEDLTDPTSGLKQLLKALPDGGAPKATYVKGDRVVVVAGDLNTLEGTVEDVRPDDGKLLVRPDLMADQVVELELDEVQKLFKAGDHVRVLSGPHGGQRGMVVAVQDGVCILLPDTQKEELKVFLKDLTEAAADSSTGIEVLGGKYELHDLVQLDANTAGVIIGIDKDYARVLTNSSTIAKPDVRMCKESDIMRKLDMRRTSTVDMNNAVINVGDYCALEGAQGAARPGGGAKGPQGGTVHAISRGVLFLRDPKLQTQGGFFVVRNRQVRLRGSNSPAAAANGAPGAAAPGVGMGGAAAGMGMGVLASPQHAPGAGPQNPFGPGGDMGGRGGGGFGGGRGGGRGRGHGGGLMGQEVVVRGGPYARYKGRVKQETATHLQLELDAINKIVTVKRQDVLGTPGRGGGMMAAGRGGFVPGRGPMGGFGGFNPAAAAAGGVPRTPAHAMQTPLHPSMGGATPLHPSMGGATPLHPSMTPMHPSMTPMHPGMTPAHPSSEPDYYAAAPGAGSWGGSGSGGYGGAAAAAGGRGPPPPAAATPGGFGGYGGPGGAVASTPGGLGSYVPAPTPGTAETPGGAFADPGNARTPGAMAATPGGADAYGVTAYTPGGYAPAQTPGGADMPAPSPAAGGPGGYGSDAYYAQPTPGMGATPGTVATPGMVELVEVDKKDRVKVVFGDKAGKVGEVMTFDGGDAVLEDGDVIDRTMLGKLQAQ